MVVQALRVDASHLDKVARLFDAYRGFYGQPSNLTQSRDFIAERITRDESAIFLAEDAAGHALICAVVPDVFLHRRPPHLVAQRPVHHPRGPWVRGGDVADEHRP
jgi:hypothetical protein